MAHPRDAARPAAGHRARSQLHPECLCRSTPTPAWPRFGAFSYDHEAGEWERLVSDFDRLGLEAVQLGTGLLDECLEDADSAAKRRGYLEDHGIRVAALAGYRNLVSPDGAVRAANIDYLRRCLELAPTLGTFVVATETGTRDPTGDWTDSPENWDDEAWRLLDDALEHLLPAAEEVGRDPRARGPRQERPQDAGPGSRAARPLPEPQPPARLRPVQLPLAPPPSGPGASHRRASRPLRGPLRGRAPQGREPARCRGRKPVVRHRRLRPGAVPPIPPRTQARPAADPRALDPRGGPAGDQRACGPWQSRRPGAPEAQIPRLRFLDDRGAPQSPAADLERLRPWLSGCD